MSASLIVNVWASLASIIVAVAIGLYVHYSKHPLLDNIKIPPWEYSAITLFLVFALNPLIIHIGKNIAVSHQTSYQEFLEGVELQPYPVVHQCYESEWDGTSTGGCTHTYNVDHYEVFVPERGHDEPNPDGKGTHYVVDAPAHYEPHDRQRPYTTTETDWIIPTTLGDFEVGTNWLPEQPEYHRLMPKRGQDANEGLPGGLPIGIPPVWTAANNRVASGHPGPVVKEHTYQSYLLASVNTRLRAYSSDIGRFQKMGVLPDLRHDVYDYYFSDSVYFAGVRVTNPAEWQNKLAKLNSQIGPNLQGRLYVVVVDANKVSEHETTQYITALTAYWQSAHFDRWAISKNAIIVALGTKNGSRVDWSDASTGMPSGNEALLYDLAHNLTGTAFTPNALFGDVTLATAKNDKGFTVSGSGDDGALGRIIFGPDKFQRVHMGTLAYLKGDIALTGGEKALILFANFLFSLIAWAAIALWAVPSYQTWRESRQPAEGPR
jgi:hypothetical protein